MSLDLTALEFRNVLCGMGWEVCPAEWTTRYMNSKAGGLYAIHVPPTDFQKTNGFTPPPVMLTAGETPHFVIEGKYKTHHLWILNNKFFFHEGEPVDGGSITPMAFEAGFDRARELVGTTPKLYRHPSLRPAAAATVVSPR